MMMAADTKIRSHSFAETDLVTVLCVGEGAEAVTPGWEPIAILTGLVRKRLVVCVVTASPSSVGSDTRPISLSRLNRFSSARMSAAFW